MSDRKNPDYTLNMFHDVHTDSKEPCISFVVQTTKVFVSFRYDILLSASVDGRTITIAIRGLHAPELLMPGSGPAIGIEQLTGLVGHYTLNVVKQDKTVNSYDVEIGESDVTVLRSPQESFITVSTDPIDPS